jgi:hypothetical protein
LKTGKQAQEQAAQIAGIDESGKRVSDTYDLKEETSGGSLSGLRVTRISSTSPMRTYYGLAKDDVIVEFGAAGSMMKVRETNDEGMARALIAQAYQTKQPLLVMRAGQPITLDGSKNPSPAAASPSAGGDSLQDQLNKIQTPR